MKKRSLMLAGTFLPIFLSSASAAPPDAGSLLREEMRREQGGDPARLALPDASKETSSQQPAGPRIAVRGFRIEGLTSIPLSEAQDYLATLLSQQALTLEELHRIAARFEQWLRSRGLFVARAWIPPQEIRDGIVELRVLEGKVEELEIKRAPQMRLPEAFMRETLTGLLPPGAALEQARLERGLLLLNDLPATSARAVLAPGKTPGQSRLIVEAAQGPVIDGNLEFDNTGSRYTGEWRLGAALALNDAYGLGDQWSMRVAATQGSSFHRLGWTMPLGTAGWKLSAAYLGSRYELCCAREVAGLDANGEASAFTLGASYPWWRSRLLNLSFALSASRRDFVNRQLGTTTSDKRTDSLTLTALGNWTDLSGKGIFYTWSLNWTSGSLDLSGSAADRNQDAATARSAGRYDKIHGSFARLQRLDHSSAFYLAFSGQWARKNLDSSEKFSLGGPRGVRAYPTGEAAADMGWLVNLEWRRDFEEHWKAVLFADHGEVKLHAHPWSNWNAATPNMPNRYALSGIGASLFYSPKPTTQLSATLASRIGKNPGRDTSGRNADGRPAHLRLWLQANMSF